MTSQSFQRFASVTAILSAPLAFASTVLLFAAVNYNLETFDGALLLSQAGTAGARFAYWSMVLDMLGYYLLIAPLMLFLWRWLKPKQPDWVGFFTICGLAYVLIGAIGAAILAAVVPSLIAEYQVASAPRREMLELVFNTTLNMVYGGLWNMLEEFVAGVGWIGIGLFLRRERPSIGIITIILGLAALIDSVGTTLGIEAIAQPSLYVYLILAPLWALWLGIILLWPLPVEAGVDE